MPSGRRAGFELDLLFCFIIDDKINWNLAKGVWGATAKPPIAAAGGLPLGAMN